MYGKLLQRIPYNEVFCNVRLSSEKLVTAFTADSKNKQKCFYIYWLYNIQIHEN